MSHCNVLLCYALTIFSITWGLMASVLFFIFLCHYLFIVSGCTWLNQLFAKVWLSLVFFRLLSLSWAKRLEKPHVHVLGSWWPANLCAMNPFPYHPFQEPYIHKLPVIKSQDIFVIVVRFLLCSSTWQSWVPSLYEFLSLDLVFLATWVATRILRSSRYLLFLWCGKDGWSEPNLSCVFSLRGDILIEEREVMEKR